MGLFIRQNDQRSQLQERIAAEMRERTKLQASGAEPLDQTKNSNYLKDTEQTSQRAGKGLIIVGAIVVGLIVFILAR